MDLTECLDRARTLYSKKTAIICGETTLSYGEFHARVSGLGAALQGLGVAKGDRVAFMMLNCHRHLELFYGSWSIGAVVVPLNVRLSPQEVAFMINDSGAKVLAVDDVLLPMVEAIRPKLEGVSHFIFTGEYGLPGGMLAYEDILAQAPADPVKVAVAGDDLAGIFYTGGTTGLPKGVMLSHDALMTNAVQMKSVMELSKDDRYLHVAPMFHMAAMAATTIATELGLTQAFVKMFIPDFVFQAIERHRISAELLIPAMLNLLVNHPEFDNYNLSSLKMIGYGASPMPVEVLRKAMGKLPGVKFYQVYGMTEMAPALTMLTYEEHLLEGPPEVTARLASAGRPLPGVRLRVVNDRGEDVKPGEIGEVIAQGANMMQGYWKRPAETEEAIRDGWYYSGDMATVDDEGYVFIVDRRKDMIVSGGENVYSTEVENVLYEHPAVLEAAVIGVPDEKWGEAVKAVVVLKPGQAATAEEIIAFCKSQIASYKAPKSVDFVESLPKSGANKVLKRDLREPYWAGHGRRVN